MAFVSRADQESRDAQLACKKSFPSSVSNVLAMRRLLVLIAAFIGICSGLRCWVDHQATESVDCGPHSGCIKVAEKNITNLGTKSWYGIQVDHKVWKSVKKSHIQVFLFRFGHPITVHIETVLKRDCFVLRVPDRCFEADNNLTYCWCMWNDFCNHSFNKLQSDLKIPWGFAFIVMIMKWKT